MTALKQGFTPDVLVDDMSALLYIIRTEIESRVNTIDIVRVINVNEDNTIDVIPIIKGVDNDKNPIDEVPIYGIPYIEWQFGVNVIKAKPAIGDVGLLLVNKKDTSSINAGIVSNNLKFNSGNGIYLGGLKGFNAVPTQSIEFTENGIDINTTGVVNINATTVNLGGQGGLGVATIGKRVTTDGTQSGTTVGFIAEGSAIVNAK